MGFAFPVLTKSVCTVISPHFLKEVEILSRMICSPLKKIRSVVSIYILPQISSSSYCLLVKVSENIVENKFIKFVMNKIVF